MFLKLLHNHLVRVLTTHLTHKIYFHNILDSQTPNVNLGEHTVVNHVLSEELSRYQSLQKKVIIIKEYKGSE